MNQLSWVSVWLSLIMFAPPLSTPAQTPDRGDDRSSDALTPSVQEQSSLEQPASWQAATYGSVRQEVLAWLESHDASELQRLKIEAIWPKTEPSFEDAQPLLDRLALTLPILDPALEAFVEVLQQPRRSSELPQAFLEVHANERPLIDQTMRLLMGRWLCENEFYDEALEQMRALDPHAVIDPASLLFYRGIAHQRLLDKENTIADFETLLENAGQLPDRYERIAELVLADIKPLKSDTLEEIAKLMEDVRRRQSLHRSGAKVLQQEQRVVDKLTKLIDDLEKQQQQQQQGQQGQAGSSAPSQAMESSRIAGGRGEGNVDRKNQTADRAWGNLDPQDRAAALAELAKDLPAHYREVIEDYFRKLAEDDKINPRERE